jgi:hypothetical protein
MGQFCIEHPRKIDCRAFSPTPFRLLLSFDLPLNGEPCDGRGYQRTGKANEAACQIFMGRHRAANPFWPLCMLKFEKASLSAAVGKGMRKTESADYHA